MTSLFYTMRMKKYLTLTGVIIWLAFGIKTVIKINYPPTLEQLGILNFFGLSGDKYLWLLRILTLGILGISLGVWKKAIDRFDKSVSRWSVVIMATTPVFLVLAMMDPEVTIKLLIISLIIFFGLKYFPKRWWSFWVLAAVFSIGFNYVVLGYRPAILNQFSLKNAQAEVTTRITDEDSLSPKIIFPVWWRRIAYNKFYFIYKDTVSEFLPFFDLESIFFQEVHPLDQKSVVMFYWIEMYVFILGLYFLIKDNQKPINRFILLSFLLSWIDFVFTEGSPYLRLILVVFPFSAVIAKGIESLQNLAGKKYILAQIVYPTILLIIIYGIGINYYDMTVRTQKWFDNRPLVFQFWYEKLAKTDISSYNRIQISALVGDSKAYCYFYLGKVCDQNKFVFSSFDLSTEKAVPNSLYAGFSGEFMGPRFKNDIDPNWKNITEAKGFYFLETESLADTVAYKYGNDIGLAIKR